MYATIESCGAKQYPIALVLSVSFEHLGSTDKPLKGAQSTITARRSQVVLIPNLSSG